MQRSIATGLTAAALTCLATTAAFAGGEHWTSNYEGAQATAAEEDKDLLLDFTGSDWCGWCIRLNEEVFSHDEFNEYADENFVLVELDYPTEAKQAQMPEEVVAQNEELRVQFDIQGYPSIILTDAQGRPYAQTGYQEGGPAAYVAHLEELKQTRIDRDEKLHSASDAEGLEKAALLHDAMQVVGDDLAVKFYGSIVEQIMELDADNEAGLLGHYEGLFRAQEQRNALNEALGAGDSAAVIAAIEEFLTAEDLEASIIQEALATKSQIMFFELEDKEGAKAVLIEAIAADPDSEMGAMLQGALENFFGDDAE